MHFYLAKLVFQIVCGGGNHTPQFDEQLRLVCAENEETALQEARLLGEQGASAFFNDKQQLVRWHFVAITELHCVLPNLHGAEVASQVVEASDAATYLSFARHKAGLLHQRQNLSSCLKY